MANVRPARVITGEVRLSYANLLQPRTDNNNETKYSVTLLIPKSDTGTKQRIDAAIDAAIKDGVSKKWNGTAPAQIPNPIHDGDGLKQSGDPYGEECKGHWVITASSKQKPEIIDTNMNPVFEPSEIYSGMYGKVSFNLYAYNFNGKKGIGAGLGNVQKTRDGESLSGGATAAEDFGYTSAQTQPAMNQQTAPINPITGLPM